MSDIKCYASNRAMKYQLSDVSVAENMPINEGSNAGESRDAGEHVFESRLPVIRLFHSSLSSLAA